MALPSSGQISIDDIRTELGSTNGSLRTLSAAAGFSTPDSMSEFYGYSAFTPISASLLSGLIAGFQADNPNSYSGTGTTWSDISGNGYDATLYNGVSYVSSGGGYFSFDGSNDYAQYSPTITAAASVVTVAKSPNSSWNGAAGLGVSRAAGGFVQQNLQSSTAVAMFWYNEYGNVSVGYYMQPTSAYTITNWNMYTNVTNGSSTNIGYVNGTQRGGGFGNSSRVNSKNITVTLGRDSNYTGVYIHAHLLYNRVLSVSEIGSLWSYFDAKLP